LELTSPGKPTTLSSRIIKTEPVAWESLSFIQHDEFKELPPEAHAKLKASILANQFTQPFYVWQSLQTDELFCLDGKHRFKILHELLLEGHDIPEMLPATFVACNTKKEAASLVLTYSSIYAKITQQGLFDFLQMHELDYVAIKETVDLPEFSTDRYEQKFDLFHLRDSQNADYDGDIEIVEETQIKIGDFFQLGEHMIICGSFLERVILEMLMADVMLRILITDPPYNIPATVFTKKHDNFDMAAGEMDHEEFVVFLMAIMNSAITYSVPGAVHYIFMDWRHSWHMTEAARRAYGSPIPKQVCVWAKDVFANGSFYRSQQELCFVFNDARSKALWNNDMLDHGGFYKDDDELVFIFKNPDGAKHLSHLELKDRTRSNVWKYPTAVHVKGPEFFDLKDHPTPKPVAMIADAILDTTNTGDIVADWFLGSGTTVIACEKTNRKCRGSEIKPQFVHTIIRRYITYCEKNNKQITFKHLNGSLTLKDFTHGKTIGRGKNN
jgi:DNA modification methylase